MCVWVQALTTYHNLHLREHLYPEVQESNSSIQRTTMPVPNEFFQYFQHVNIQLHFSSEDRYAATGPPVQHCCIFFEPLPLNYTPQCYSPKVSPYKELFRLPWHKSQSMHANDLVFH